MDSIAIIGTGIAGLVAARQCQLQGIHTVLFEKSKHVGGRLSSHRSSWARFDQGAQYFTARSPEFQEQLQLWQHTGHAQVWDFQAHRFRQGQLNPSPDTETRYVGTPCMNSLAEALAEDLSIHYHCHIAQISYETAADDEQQGEWWLYDRKGQQYGGFDALLLALPSAQCQALIDARSPLQKVLQTVAMVPCWSLAVAFDEAIADASIQGIFCDHPIVQWISRESAKPGRLQSHDCWIIHCRPEWSEQQKDQPQSVIQATLLQALAEILSIALPTASHYYCHFWRYARPAHSQCFKQALVDPQQRLGVCGDWQQGGRVEGAYLSAIQTSQALLQCGAIGSSM
jgi:predicted NAD/FAD-dependent oxidoreductase